MSSCYDRFFFFSSRRRHTRFDCDWSSDVCSSDLVPVAVVADIRALFTQDPDALEDPDCYPLARDATQIDLRPAVREELLLAAPQWVVCREDCRGLCPRCGKDLNAGPCGCPPAGDPRWQALAAFQGKSRD